MRVRQAGQQAPLQRAAWTPAAGLRPAGARDSGCQPGPPLPAELVFIARLPPLGYSSFFVQPASGAGGCGGAGGGGSAAGAQQARRGVGASEEGRFVTLDNGLVRLDYDADTGGWSLRV